MKIVKCKGEGQGSCKSCNDKGIWNVNWMSLLYKIEGYESYYCSKCLQEIINEHKGETIEYEE